MSRECPMPACKYGRFDVGYIGTGEIKLKISAHSFGLVCLAEKFDRVPWYVPFACAPQDRAIMSLKSAPRISVLFLGAIFCSLASVSLAAQDQPRRIRHGRIRPCKSRLRRLKRSKEQNSSWLWPWLKEGKISFSSRWRLEAFERDGAPFTATAYAPTLRLALGYETPAYRGFSIFAQGEAVIVTGPADYSVPALPLAEPPKSSRHPGPEKPGNESGLCEVDAQRIGQECDRNRWPPGVDPE